MWIKIMQSYNQLDEYKRAQLEVLNKQQISQSKIALELGVNQSTISRELRRNKGKRGYRHKQANNKAINRRQSTCKAHKMTKEFKDKIIKLLKQDWSPEQISGTLKAEDNISISHETIYRLVWGDKDVGGSLYTHLRRKGKKYNKRGQGKSSRGQIKNRVSIDHRPKVVDDKLRIGDWEIDTVIGKNHSGALVTIVERKTKFALAMQVDSKKAEDVTRATIELLRPYKELVHTITSDNGKEFAYHDQIADQLNTEVYFAHPYSSWERGLNENTNGLLRQYFPKGTEFKQVSQDQVDQAISKLNGRPSKLLEYKRPEQLFLAHTALQKVA